MSKIADKRIKKMINEAVNSEEYIDPILYEYEAKKLIMSIDGYINSIDSVKKYFRSITSSSEYRNRAVDKKITISKFHKEVIKCWNELPKGLVKDIFKLYLHPIDDLKFTKKSNSTHIHYKILAVANKPLAKIMTEGSFLKSMVFTRGIIVFLLIQFAKMNLLKHEEDKFMKINLQIDDDEDIDEWDQKFDKMINDVLNKRLKNLSDQEAMKLASDLDSQINKSEQDALTKYLAAGKIGPRKEDLLLRFNGKLLKMELAGKELNDWIQLLLEKSKKYHLIEQKNEYELFIDSDNYNHFENHQLIHPRIRNIFLDDILVKKETRKEKLNLYIDISGSMEAWKLKDSLDNNITSMDFAKAISVEMSNQNIIDEVFLFNQEIISYDNSPDSLAKIISQGGTDIKKVVEHIKAQGKKSIVITDAFDKCDKYSDLVFFIGVKGANFTHFSKECLIDYTQNEQMVMFDGKSIYNIGITGHIIK